jgi:glycerol uptake facilitator-like aquaporin
VGLYIMAGYWFTSSTSFANPAVTLARSLTDSFTGIRPMDIPGFLAAQCLALGVLVITLKAQKPSSTAMD